MDAEFWAGKGKEEKIARQMGKRRIFVRIFTDFCKDIVL